jgi:hypothetical protein
VRPFARRRLITFCPLLVRILFIKPCTRFILLFFGWYVRFISRSTFPDELEPVFSSDFFFPL